MNQTDRDRQLVGINETTSSSSNIIPSIVVY